MGGKLKVWYIIAGVLMAVAIGLTIIPTHTYETKIKETEDEILGKTDGSERVDAGGLIIVGQTKEGSYKFNRIFGGTNYSGEVSKYEEAHPKLGYQSLEDALKAEDLNAKFDALNFDEKEVLEYYANKTGIDTVTVGSVEAFNSTMETEPFKFIVADTTVVGIINDYYLLVWYADTDTFFLVDGRDMLFSEDYWGNQLFHIGKTYEFNFYVRHYDTCVLDGRQVYFVGSMQSDLGIEWRAQDEIELPVILR